MVCIGRMPRRCRSFFKPIRDEFSKPAFEHLWRLVLAWTVSHGCTIDRLAKLIGESTHRTNHGEFLWRSYWDESWVLEQIALETIKRLRRKGRRPRRAYLIVDDTQTLKRARKMDGVGKLYHHATGRYGMGHTVFKACLWIAGVTIPLRTALYVKKEQAADLHIDFKTLTELAAEAIRGVELPHDLEITVLFDAYYLCPKVVEACRSRGWHYIGVGKRNRNFTIDGRVRKLGQYGRNALRRRGRWFTVTGLKRTNQYRLAERVGHLKGLGDVKVVFSRRRADRAVVALVTDDIHASMKQVVSDYLKRWAVELLIKDEKQHLGMGDYRVKRYRAVVRHLHLADLAYACLTHLALTEPGAQGQDRTKTVLSLPPISQLKARMRQQVWRQGVNDVVRVSHERRVIRRLEKLLPAA